MGVVLMRSCRDKEEVEDVFFLDEDKGANLMAAVSDRWVTVTLNWGHVCVIAHALCILGL